MGDEGEHLMPEGYINTSELYREGSETQEVEENLNPMGFFGMHLHVKKTFTHGQDGDLEETEGRHRSKSFIEVIVDKLGGGGTTIASSVYNLSATSIGAGIYIYIYIYRCSLSTICFENRWIRNWVIIFIWRSFDGYLEFVYSIEDRRSS